MSAINDIIRDAKREERDDIVMAILRASAKIDMDPEDVKELLCIAGVVDDDEGSEI